MPPTPLNQLRARRSNVLTELDTAESQIDQAARWTLIASRTLASISDALERARYKRDRLATTSSKRQTLEQQITALRKAREKITDDFIRDVARLGDELAEINARLDRLVSDAESTAQSLHRFRATASEVIGYAGKILSIAGAILGFGV